MFRICRSTLRYRSQRSDDADLLVAIKQVTRERQKAYLGHKTGQCGTLNGPKQRWSLDFVSDVLTDDRHFRILAVVNDFSFENFMLMADTSLSG